VWRRGAWLWALLAVAAGGAAQPAEGPPQAQAPRLLRRAALGDAPRASGIYRPGFSGLPDEASGSYALSTTPGEAIEIILNGQGRDCRLQGYLTRLGDGESDRGAALTYFFEQTSVSPEQLQFTTRLVHGVWWTFSGRIDRGSVPQPSQKGYYFLNGTLVEHFDSGESQARRVSLPLLPQGREPSP
jgi:hypothetical protein